MLNPIFKNNVTSDSEEDFIKFFALHLYLVETDEDNSPTSFFQQHEYSVHLSIS